MDKITLSKSLRIPGTNIILEAGDSVSYGQRVDEAFRHEVAKTVVSKMCNVIGRRMGKNVRPIFPGFDMNNKSGSLVTYFCIFTDTRTMFAINFKNSGSSDQVYSIGLIDNVEAPFDFSSEILFNGYNIVQIIDQIVEVLSGDSLNFMEDSEFSLKALNNSTKFVPVKEGVSLKEMAAVWMQDNPNFIPQIESDSFDYNANINDFNAFIKAKYGSGRAVKPGALKYYCKHALLDNPKMGNGSKIPSVSVVSGSTAAQVAPVATKWDSLIDEIIHMDYKEKWDLFENYVSLIATGKRNGLVCYGMPGTGKTHNTQKVLTEHGIPYIEGENVMRGGFDDDVPLITFLYKNRDEQVVIFDDCDSLLFTRSQIRKNLVKNLLDPKEVRMIGLNKVIRDKETGGSIPPTFPFKARVICLSNLSIDKIDAAVLSRCLSLELTFTVEEMLSMIKDKLEDLGEDDWELTIQDKMDVYDFYLEILPRIKEVSFRTFKFALQGKSIANALGRDWRRYCLTLTLKYIRESV